MTEPFADPAGPHKAEASLGYVLANPVLNDQEPLPSVLVGPATFAHPCLKEAE